MSRRSKALPPVALRPGPQLVADEQVAGDPLDLLAVHQVEAAPPALELEEARRLGVDVREQVVVLVPERIGRIEVLEVLDQVRAVEDAVAHVGRERRQPRAAQHAARVTHRVVAGTLLERAAPVRHRRAVDHDRAGVVRVRGGEHHRRPAALAVADDRRLRAGRMQRAHLLHELLLGIADVEKRLPRLGIAEEDHEVDGVPLAQRDADLRIVLEAADAGAVAGARIDDHVGPALRVDLHALRRDDSHQRVVDGPGELASVDYRLVLEMQNRGQSLPIVLDEVVAALAQRVHDQDRALREIGRVLDPLRPEVGWGGGPLGEARRAIGVRLGEPLTEMFLRQLRPLLVELRHLAGNVEALCDLLGCVHGCALPVSQRTALPRTPSPQTAHALRLLRVGPAGSGLVQARPACAERVRSSRAGMPPTRPLRMLFDYPFGLSRYWIF